MSEKKDEDFAVTDLLLSFRIDPAILTLKLNNVFNQSYQMVDGYPLPGRWIWGEITLNF